MTQLYVLEKELVLDQIIVNVILDIQVTIVNTQFVMANLLQIQLFVLHTEHAQIQTTVFVNLDTLAQIVN